MKDEHYGTRNQLRHFRDDICTEENVAIVALEPCFTHSILCVRQNQKFLGKFALPSKFFVLDFISASKP